MNYSDYSRSGYRKVPNDASLELARIESARIQAEATAQWLSTPDGKKALEEVARRGTPFSDALKKARKFDWRKTQEPTTI